MIKTSLRSDCPSPHPSLSSLGETSPLPPSNIFFLPTHGGLLNKPGIKLSENLNQNSSERGGGGSYRGRAAWANLFFFLMLLLPGLLANADIPSLRRNHRHSYLSDPSLGHIERACLRTREDDCC